MLLDHPSRPLDLGRDPDRVRERRPARRAAPEAGLVRGRRRDDCPGGQPRAHDRVQDGGRRPGPALRRPGDGRGAARAADAQAEHPPLVQRGGPARGPLRGQPRRDERDQGRVEVAVRRGARRGPGPPAPARALAGGRAPARAGAPVGARGDRAPASAARAGDRRRARGVEPRRRGAAAAPRRALAPLALGRRPRADAIPARRDRRPALVRPRGPRSRARAPPLARPDRPPCAPCRTRPIPTTIRTRIPPP